MAEAYHPLFPWKEWGLFHLNLTGEGIDNQLPASYSQYYGGTSEQHQQLSETERVELLDALGVDLERHSHRMSPEQAGEIDWRIAA